MEDITDSIVKAIRQDVLWMQTLVYVVEKLQNNGYTISFWENEENWAIMLRNDSVIGYMWKKYPLVFIKSPYNDAIKELLQEEQPVVFIDVNDVTEKAFVIDYRVLKDYIEYGLADDGFSAEDFWFVTNT
ncbi:hypothetical protein HGH93_30785 [Chitinophaga polysaccharea]|uniref:hypothetical protein n=1 Tax=Chitinophaga polysaccharea TaxID=1293035 RepID=UPI001454FA9A|nr:hypothetical protein [Chitinophaga polysaccharea]NLR62518.1 hypothetical protein [Chitinophaga polysaccharea]